LEGCAKDAGSDTGRAFEVGGVGVGPRGTGLLAYEVGKIELRSEWAEAGGAVGLRQ